MSNLPLEGPASFLYANGFGTLSYGLPAAIGAKMGAPDRQAVALHGDGDIRREMVDRREPVHGVHLPGVDFVKVAKGLNCHGVTVNDEDRLVTALRKALASGHPTVIHVVGDLAGA